MTLEDARKVMKKMREIEAIFNQYGEGNHEADLFVEVTDYSIECIISMPTRDIEEYATGLAEHVQSLLQEEEEEI